MSPICLLLVSMLFAGAAIAGGDASSRPSWPARWPGVVTHVSDGDSLWVRPAAGGPPRRIRLYGIDAPEACQAHGQTARAALAQRVLGHEVLVQALRRDSYDRLVARVALGEQDVARGLVHEGHAWSDRYRRSRGPYQREEAEARRAQRGLFAARDPELPVDFRRRHGACERR